MLLWIKSKQNNSTFEQSFNAPLVFISEETEREAKYMKISEAQKLVERLAEEFEEKWKAERENAPQLYFVDMVETLGELAGTIKVKEFWRTEPEFYRAKPKKNVEKGLVDFLFDILMIANFYNVNLEKAFIERMQQFRKKFLQR
jgi:NTP pyrophosphatase (non-canonical NTP hydrolase)